MLALSWALQSAGQLHSFELSMCLHCCSGPRRSINRDYPHFPGYSRAWVRPAEELTSLSRKQNIIFGLNNVGAFSKKL